MFIWAARAFWVLGGAAALYWIYTRLGEDEPRGDINLPPEK